MVEEEKKPKAEGEKEEPEKELESEESSQEEKAEERAPEPETEQAEAKTERKEEPEEGAEEKSIEPSPELKQALEEAVKVFEEKEKKQEAPPPPSEEVLKLRLEIIDLKHRIRELEAELEQKVKEIKQNYEQAMLIKKQFDDYKARVMKERADWFNYGHEPIIKELLTVVDNLERAIAHANRPEDFDSLKQGVELTYKQFLQVLEKFGVKQIKALGEPFDPNYHEAMATKESKDHPPGTVIEEHIKGYMLKDRLLRPSMVTTSVFPQEEKEKKTEEESSEEKTTDQTPEDQESETKAEPKSPEREDE